jgi:hypothetical protein
MPVYASSGKGVLSFSPLNLTQLQEVVELVDPLDILACNVGVALYDDMSSCRDPSTARRQPVRRL